MNRTGSDRPTKKEAVPKDVTLAMEDEGIIELNRWLASHYYTDIPPSDYQARQLVKMIAQATLRIVRKTHAL